MKKFRKGVLFLILVTSCMYIYLKSCWTTFEEPYIYNMEVKTDKTELEEIAGKWIEQYINCFEGIKVPYSHRIKDMKIKNIEILNKDAGYVQIDYLVKPAIESYYFYQSFPDIIADEDGWYMRQEVLQFKESKNGYTPVISMRPVEYQIQTDPNLATEGKNTNINISAKQDNDYLVNNGMLYITFDKGITSKKVPIKYDLVAYNPVSSLDKKIPEGSYIIEKDYIAFLYVDDGLKLIYSFDQGETWDKTIINDNEKGYYRARFLSKTENNYYVVYSTDKAMSAEGHGFSMSEDGIQFNKTEYHDPEQRVMTYAYFVSDNIGYVAYTKNEPGNSRSFYRTIDGGKTFEPINFDLYEVSYGDDYTGTPFIEVDKIYQQDGYIHIIVGQGTYGDYGHKQAEYISEDGYHFTFYQVIESTSREDG